MNEKPVIALVEVPKGSRNKYEYDEASSQLGFDCVLYSPLHSPADCGCIVGTLAEDGDHLDVRIVTYEPTFPGCLVPVRPVGVLDMRDEKGRDQKILAVPTVDPRFDEVADLSPPPAALPRRNRALLPGLPGARSEGHGDLRVGGGGGGVASRDRRSEPVSLSLGRQG